MNIILQFNTSIIDKITIKITKSQMQ